MNVYNGMSIRRRAVASVFNGQGTINLALGADLTVKEALARSAIEAARHHAADRATELPMQGTPNER